MSQEVAMIRLTAIARGFLGRRTAATQRRRRLRPSPPPAPKPKRTRRTLTKAQVEYLAVLTQRCFFNMEDAAAGTGAGTGAGAGADIGANTGADTGIARAVNKKSDSAAGYGDTGMRNMLVLCG